MLDLGCQGCVEKQRRIEELEQELADRKLVERAKGLIMVYQQMDEERAHRFLQKAASRKGMKLADAARAVIDAAELCGYQEAAD